MKMQKIFGELALFLAAVIWGTTFSVQKAGAEHLTPNVFNALRMMIGTVFLIPVIMIADYLREKHFAFWGTAQTPADRKRLLIGGTLNGAVLAGGSMLQQWGLQYTSAGKAGFLTSLYIIGVPLIGLFFHRKSSRLLWVCSAMAFSGTCLLSSWDGSGGMNPGELLLLGCALMFTLHILLIDHYAPGTDCLRLSQIQFFSGSLFAALGSLLFQEPWLWKNICAGAGAFLFCGIFSNGIAFTLQIAGQKHIHPVTATLIMCLESVFSVIGGYFVLHEVLSARELWGCLIIFLAVILVQVPFEELLKRKES